MILMSEDELHQPGHHRKVVPVEEELSQHLEGLPPGHIVVAVQQALVLVEHLAMNNFAELNK